MRLENMNYKKSQRLGCSPWRREGLKGYFVAGHSVACKFCKETTQKMEPDSSWKCVVKIQKAIEHAGKWEILIRY